MPVLETIENVQDQVLDTIGSVQTRVIKTNKKIAGQINDTFADRVDAFTDRMPTVPFLDSVTDRIPAPKVAVSTYFDLVERATKANRKFALDLVSVWAPAKADSAKPAAKKAAASKPAAKKAVRKPVAKKATATKRRAAAKPAAKKATTAAKTVTSTVSADTKA